MDSGASNMQHSQLILNCIIWSPCIRCIGVVVTANVGGSVAMCLSQGVGLDFHDQLKSCNKIYLIHIIITLCACTRGKVIGRVVIVVNTKIAKISKK